MRLPLFIYFFKQVVGLRGHQQPYAGYAVKRMDELGLQVYLYAATCILLHVTKAAAQHSANVTK